jgi:hypothetical protein
MTASDDPGRAMRVEAQVGVPPEEAGSGLGGEEYVLGIDGCPTCGITLGGALKEPATANDPHSLRKQSYNLRKLQQAFLAGQISRQQVGERIQDLCPICRATMDRGDLAGDLAAELSYQADLLEDRAANLEHG